jgi:hypothetical protein
MHVGIRALIPTVSFRRRKDSHIFAFALQSDT